MNLRKVKTFQTYIVFSKVQIVLQFVPKKVAIEAAVVVNVVVTVIFFSSVRILPFGDMIFSFNYSLKVST